MLGHYVLRALCIVATKHGMQWSDLGVWLRRLNYGACLWQPTDCGDMAAARDCGDPANARDCGVPADACDCGVLADARDCGDQAAACDFVGSHASSAYTQTNI